MTLSKKQQAIVNRLTKKVESKEGERVLLDKAFAYPDLRVYKLLELPFIIYWAELVDGKQYEASFMLYEGLRKEHEETALYTLGHRQAQLLCEKEGHPKGQITIFKKTKLCKRCTTVWKKYGINWVEQ